MNEKGYSGNNMDVLFSNGKVTLGDLKPENIGIDTEGKIRILDLNVIHH